VEALSLNTENEVLVASVSIPELGRRLLASGADRAIVAVTLDRTLALSSEIVSIDAAIARQALLLGMQCPQRLPLTDSLIAACARNRGAILVHRDKHMAAIPSELVKQINLAAK
jgi:predicted nucleic acid-binding protein